MLKNGPSHHIIRYASFNHLYTHIGSPLLYIERIHAHISPHSVCNRIQLLDFWIFKWNVLRAPDTHIRTELCAYPWRWQTQAEILCLFLFFYSFAVRVQVCMCVEEDVFSVGNKLNTISEHAIQPISSGCGAPTGADLLIETSFTQLKYSIFVVKLLVLSVSVYVFRATLSVSVDSLGCGVELNMKYHLSRTLTMDLTSYKFTIRVGTLSSTVVRTVTHAGTHIHATSIHSRRTYAWTQMEWISNGCKRFSWSVHEPPTIRADIKIRAKTMCRHEFDRMFSPETVCRKPKRKLRKHKA